MFGSAIRRQLTNHLTYVADGEAEKIDFPGYQVFSLDQAFKRGKDKDFLVQGTLEKSHDLTIDEKYFWSPKNRWSEIKKVLYLKDELKELFRVTLIGTYAQEFDQFASHLEKAVVSILHPQIIARIPRRNENDVDINDTTRQSKYEVLVGYEHVGAKIVVQDIKIQEKSYLATTTPIIHIDPNENDVLEENAKEVDEEEQESVSSTASTLMPVAPEKSPQIINLSRKSPAKSDIVLSSDTEDEEEQAKEQDKAIEGDIEEATFSNETLRNILTSSLEELPSTSKKGRSSGTEKRKRSEISDPEDEPLASKKSKNSKIFKKCSVLLEKIDVNSHSQYKMYTDKIDKQRVQKTKKSKKVDTNVTQEEMQKNIESAIDILDEDIDQSRESTSTPTMLDEGGTPIESPVQSGSLEFTENEEIFSPNSWNDSELIPETLDIVPERRAAKNATNQIKKSKPTAQTTNKEKTFNDKLPDIIATRIYDPEPELVLTMDGDVSISYDKDVDGHGVSPNVKKFIDNMNKQNEMDEILKEVHGITREIKIVLKKLSLHNVTIPNIEESEEEEDSINLLDTTDNLMGHPDEKDKSPEKETGSGSTNRLYMYHQRRGNFARNEEENPSDTETSKREENDLTDDEDEDYEDSIPDFTEGSSPRTSPVIKSKLSGRGVGKGGHWGLKKRQDHSPGNCPTVPCPIGGKGHKGHQGRVNKLSLKRGRPKGAGNKKNRP